LVVALARVSLLLKSNVSIELHALKGDLTDVKKAFGKKGNIFVILAA
jgi:hypothetical protein